MPYHQRAVLLEHEVTWLWEPRTEELVELASTQVVGVSRLVVSVSRLAAGALQPIAWASVVEREQM